jgi:signal transduction histidine kinase
LDGGRLLASIMDITARKEQEARQRASDAAEVLAKNSASLLATMSHEIRTPLTGLVGCLELLSENTTLAAAGAPTSFAGHEPEHHSTDSKELITTARRCADVLMDTINDILSYSKLENGNEQSDSELVDPRDIVDDIRGVLWTQLSGCCLTWDCVVHESVPRVVAVDGARLRRILLNLLGNAVKFTAKGGIAIGIQCELGVVSEAMFPISGTHAFCADVLGKLAAGKLTVTIKDSGIGMSEDIQKRVFQPFMQADKNTTRHFGGTGLGLAICKRMVSLLKGDITFSSKLGEGTCFTFWVPVGVLKEPSPSSVNPETRSHLPVVEERQSSLSTVQKARVLLVDDDGVGSGVVASILKRMGCGSIAFARNGVEAVTAVQADPSINLILMDCEMPIMDGFSATAAIRELGRTLPIIAMTANAMVGDKERCLKAGMTDYLAKPVTKAALSTMLDKQLR